MINNNDLLLFAKASLNTFTFSHLNICKEKAIFFLKDEISANINELNLPKVKDKRHEYFKIDGSCSNDYTEKILSLGTGKKVIYGIRHFGGNRDFPFVHFQPNFSLSSKEEVVYVYQKVKAEFEMFCPLYVNFWSNIQLEGTSLGCVYMVSTSKNMQELPPWNKEKQISFEDICDHSYYDWYKKGYDAFHCDFPKLKDRVTVNDLDTMRTSLDQGLLKFVIYKGERIGLIAAEKSSFLDHPGIYFNEIYIEKKLKGQGLAKAIQRKFVTLFTKNSFIWGTIDAQNLPSYKTALTNARTPIRYECFVKIN
ncbi:hypothetical protein [Candidatus Uabimicrobium sp. HlEnr_7]|uniref:hypothetical protein n=1 Tax=Candidatus Uabimicrobium helgolandensis TaxID=3095367 RepID=UPI003556B7C1